MRLTWIVAATIFVTFTANGSDAFIGDWKLNPAKSGFADGRTAKDGRALIEPDNTGGYLQISETVFTDGPALRFNTRAQFDGIAGDGMLEDHFVRYVSKRIDANAFEIAISDVDTARLSKMIRVFVTPQDHTLTMLWTNSDSSPIRKLIYEKASEGPLLEAGKTIEHSFGAGAIFQYRVNLKAGEYCQGKIEQKAGSINVAAYGPDDARIHSFGGPSSGDNLFSFEAHVTGTYRIVLRSALAPAQSYAITVDKITTLEERLRAEPPKDKFTSPRIAGLRKAIESGQSDAVAAFWKEMEKQGAPLIEPIDGNEKDMLATFLWRATAETRNVLIVWYPFTPAKSDDYQMRRLADTDVWYRTLKVRAGARFAYTLSPNDPLTFDEASFLQRTATAQADPLNAHHWFDGPGATKFEYVSMVEMPGATPQPYIAKRDGVAAGKVEKHRIKSALLNNERNLSVYLPPGYQLDGTPYHLLVVFDEGAYLTNVPTPVILDNLLVEKKIPSMVAVLIANPSQESRNRELPPNPAFADFLNNELIPWVRHNYNVTTDPQQVVVAGSSFGGIASVYAGFRHPETFGNILCQSGSFWWSAQKPEPYTEPNYLAKEFLKSPKLPLRFYMDAGLFEADMNGGGFSILEPSRHMRDLLLAKGYEVHYQEFVGGHDYLSWRGTLADGLIALLGASK
jgi:enterochelin esterase-like enzyme